MYLTRRVYVGANYQHNQKEGDKVVINGVNYPVNQITELCFETAYWRKANHIHNWFVQNVQNGVDDCKKYYVPIDKLENLLQDCKDSLAYLSTLEYEGPVFNKVYKNIDEDKLMPTISGFFFGSTEYDEYYEDQLKYTIEVIEKELKREDDSDYYYSSSW